jgi:hypothetical protein
MIVSPYSAHLYSYETGQAALIGTPITQILNSSLY